MKTKHFIYLTVGILAALASYWVFRNYLQIKEKAIKVENIYFDFEEYLKQSASINDPDFINHFPYRDYLAVYSPYNISVTESHRMLLDTLGFDKDVFLIKLIKEYFAINPIDVNDILKLISDIHLGELYMNIGELVVESHTYELLGVIILSSCTKEIETAIENKDIKRSSSDFKNLDKLLTRNHYFISVKLNDFEKLLYNISQGNWEYIKNRFLTRTKKYLPFLMLILPLVTVIFIQNKIYKLKKRPL